MGEDICNSSNKIRDEFLMLLLLTLNPTETCKRKSILYTHVTQILNFDEEPTLLTCDPQPISHLYPASQANYMLL